MRNPLDIVAQALSILLYPLFVPTYGMVLFCVSYNTQEMPLPLVWALVAVLGTFILTCLLPASAIWMLIRKGAVSNMQIEKASERTMPYIYAAMGFGFWSYLLTAILHAPLYINCVAVGATVAITLVALINHWWKISAHLTACGGLLGGLFAYCLGIGALPTWPLLAIWLSVTLLLMWARLRLHAHTPTQVVCGWLLGLICTFIPYCLLCYAT